ncbi:MAG: hypothetical protein ACJ73S_31825 [Mycobacteriales bacterium]
MNELEDRLRNTFADRAGHAPDGSDLLDRVHRRDRQVTLRRRTVLAGALTLGVGAAAGAAVAVTRGDGNSDTLNPTPTGPPPSERLERANYQVPAFPLTPSYVPQGYRRIALQGSADPPGGQLSYQLNHSAPMFLLTVGEFTPSAADVESDPTFTKVQVNGTTAYWSAGDGSTMPTVYWPRRPDQMVGMQWLADQDGAVPYAEQITMDVLRGLVDKPIRVRAPFRLRWVPKHARITTVDSEELRFQIPPRGGETATGPISGTFAVSYWTPKNDGRLPQDQQPIAIRGWKHCTIGTITGGGDDVGADHLRYMIFCRIGRDRYVNVTAPTSLVTIGDMVSLTEGVTIVE